MTLRFKTLAMMMGLGLASGAVAAERTPLAVGPWSANAVRTEKAVGPVIIVDRAVRTEKAVGPWSANAVRTEKAVGPVYANAVRTDKAVGLLSSLAARANEGATSRTASPSADSAVLDLNQGF